MPKSKSQRISLADAVRMTKAYRDQPVSDLGLSQTFNRELVQSLMNETGAEFLRIYFGRNTEGAIQTIIVAADASNNDLLPSATGAARDGDDNEIGEDSIKCPPHCPPESPLNS